MRVSVIDRSRISPLHIRAWTPSGNETTLTLRAETFGERLRRLRVGRGLTQAQLADRAGCERKMLWWYERGGATVPASTLARFADALETSMDYLFRGKGEP